MCPACLTTAAAIVAATGSAGGLAALLMTALHNRRGMNAAPQPSTDGEPNESPNRLAR